MATHRKNTTGRRFGMVVLAGLGLALSGSLISAPVEAVTLTPKSKNVTTRNADTVGTCRFQATRVTPTSVHFTLSATARPAGIDGYRANVFTQVHCYVLPAGDTDPNNAFIEFHPSANGHSMYGRNLKDAVPFFDSYTLCASAQVTKQNGDTTYTPLVCA